MFRILVAEDDESTRLLMCEVLRQAGYEPCPACNGVEALEVMEHYQGLHAVAGRARCVYETGSRPAP